MRCVTIKSDYISLPAAACNLFFAYRGFAYLLMIKKFLKSLLAVEGQERVGPKEADQNNKTEEMAAAKKRQTIFA